MKFTPFWKRKPAPKASPAVIPVLREVARGVVSDGDAITLTTEFQMADHLGLLDGGSGFSTDYRLTARGRNALAGVSAHWLAWSRSASRVAPFAGAVAATRPHEE